MSTQAPEAVAPVTPATSAVPAAPAAPAAPQAAEGATPDEPLGAGGVKALNAERDARAASDREKAALKVKLQEYEDRDKTAEQRAEAERVRMQAQITALTAANAIAEASAASGIPAAILAGPVSSDAADVQAHADALAAWRAEQAPAAPAAVPPAVVPTIGQSPQVGNVSLHDQIAAATASGDKALVAALKAMQLGAAS